MLAVIFLFTLFYNGGVALLPGIATDPNREIVVRLLSLAECRGKDLPIKNLDATITKVTASKYMIDGTILVREKIDGPIKTKMVVNKCREKLRSDTCQNYMKMEGEGCKQLKEKKGVMYGIFKRTGQEVQCPIKKGTYVMQQYELQSPSGTPQIAYNVGKYWMVTMTGNSEAREILCTELYLELFDNKGGN